jgi:hypothetical protein
MIHLNIIHPLTHLRFGLLNSLFPSGLHIKNLYAFLFYPIPATCPANYILVDLIILISLGEEYKSLHPPVTPSLFGPNILLSILFSNPSGNFRDEVLQLYRTTGKIMVFYILIVTLFDSRREDRRVWTEW